MKFHTTWHFIHLIMTFLTGGLWIVIWIWRTLANSQANKREQFSR